MRLPTNQILTGHALDILRTLPDNCIDTVITSPPYWGLRDYTEEAVAVWSDGWRGQLGLEPDFNVYIEHLLEIFTEIKRVLKKSGSAWVNMGDSYGGSGGAGGDYNEGGIREGQAKYKQGKLGGYQKCLLGIPWRLANAMVDRQGWILHNEIVWYKPNAMPGSFQKRLTNKHEKIFLFTKNRKTLFWHNEKTRQIVSKKPPSPKDGIEGQDWEWREVEYDTGETKIKSNEAEMFGSPRARYRREPKRKKATLWHGHDYWFDLDAIREPHSLNAHARGKKIDGNIIMGGGPKKEIDDYKPGSWNRYLCGKEQKPSPAGKNPGDVFFEAVDFWTITTKGFPEAHFATFPEKLCGRPIMSSCPLWICTKCGLPRVRVSERISEPTRPGRIKGTGKSGKDYDPNKQLHTRDPRRHVVKDIKTIGWTDCGCKDKEWEAGIVLDPFAGAGTALVVAKKLGRRYLGIEINPDYVKMAERRLEKTSYQQSFFT